jgi:hypothetical protein
VAVVSATAGSAWAQQGALPANLSDATAVSCADDQSCWVTAHTQLGLDQATGSVVVTTDGGANWAPVVTPTGIGSLNGIDCITGSPTGSGAFPTPSTPPTTSTTPGSPVTSVAVPTTAAPAASSTTTSTTPVVGVAGVRCTAVGTTATSLDATRTGHGLVLTTDNGGATWTSERVTATAASLMDVSCTGIGSCVAVGSSVAASPAAGVVILTGSSQRPWRRAAVVSAPQPLTAVRCQSNSHCVVVGESIGEYLAGG